MSSSIRPTGRRSISLLALRNITPQTTPLEEFMRQRSQYAHGNSGVPIVGDPDHIARQLIDLSRAGLTGIAVSLVNYADELPYFRAEVLPRLERAGLRLPACRYCSLMPASRITLPHFSSSALRKAANSAGVSPIGVKPMFASFCLDVRRGDQRHHLAVQEIDDLLRRTGRDEKSGLSDLDRRDPREDRGNAALTLSMLLGIFAQQYPLSVCGTPLELPRPAGFAFCHPVGSAVLDAPAA